MTVAAPSGRDKSRRDKRGSPKKSSRHSGESASAANAKPGLATRQAAARLLAAVIDRKTPLDGMIDTKGGNPAYVSLGPADRALARAIAAAALRHGPVIDALVGSLVETPLPAGARSLHFALMAAAAQILYLDVPDRAAVDLAVEQIAADPRSRRFASLANAVLRRLSRDKEALLAGPQAAVPTLPAWFGDRLGRIYGSERAHAIAAMLNEPATIDLTVKSDPDGWAARLGGQALPTGTVRLADPEGPIAGLDGYEDGEWWVQDAAASLPARLFGPVAGLHVGDLCAAPGGKTAQLVAQGARVTALDRSSSRLGRLADNLARLSMEADLVEADCLDYRPADPFDAVLLDAPCSSTGTARRHPDIPWTKGPEDIARLAALQERLLRHAATLIKPGGRIVFSNCSLDPLEGEDIVARVLADTPALTLEPVAPTALAGLEGALQHDGTVRTTPEMLAREPARLGGVDGFYAAVIALRS